MDGHEDIAGPLEGVPVFKPGFLRHRQYTGKYQRGFADLVHMWTNGHCLNAVGKMLVTTSLTTHTARAAWTGGG